MAVKIKHQNNFDFLRLLFAFFVIITHSYALLGFKEHDWMFLTAKGFTFSYIGVRGFFIISGYLILKSLIRAKTIKNYLINRFLRLYPALFVVLILTASLGWLVSSDSIVSYFNSRSVWTYVPKNLTLYFLQYPISDTVFADNPSAFSVNGSLWTLRYEFTMYIGLVMLFFLKKNLKAIQFLLFSYFVVSLILLFGFKELIASKHFLVNGYLFFELGIYFIAGSLLASVYFNKFKFQNIFGLVSLIVLMISAYLEFLTYTIYIFFPVLVLFFGLKSTKYINNLSAKIGDLSYGLYIFAFPIQQTLIHFFNLNILQLIIFTTLIALPLSYFSWHLIEKRALNLKYRFIKNDR